MTTTPWRALLCLLLLGASVSGCAFSPTFEIRDIVRGHSEARLFERLAVDPDPSGYVAWAHDPLAPLPFNHTLFDAWWGRGNYGLLRVDAPRHETQAVHKVYYPLAPRPLSLDRNHTVNGQFSDNVTLDEIRQRARFFLLRVSGADDGRINAWAHAFVASRRSALQAPPSPSGPPAPSLQLYEHQVRIEPPFRLDAHWQSVRGNGSVEFEARQFAREEFSVRTEGWNFTFALTVKVVQRSSQSETVELRISANDHVRFERRSLTQDPGLEPNLRDDELMALLGRTFREVGLPPPTLRNATFTHVKALAD